MPAHLEFIIYSFAKKALTLHVRCAYAALTAPKLHCTAPNPLPPWSKFNWLSSSVGIRLPAAGVVVWPSVARLLLFPAFPALRCFSFCRFSRLSVYFTLSHATDTRTQGKAGNTSSNTITSGSGSSSSSSSGKVCTNFVRLALSFSLDLPLSFSFWGNSQVL